MTTYRVQRRTHDFTQIQNSTLRDERLSFRARGVLAWLLTHVDTWQASRDQIARAGREGVGAIRTAQQELTELGYLERVRVRQDDGTFEWVTNVYETPRHTTGQESTSGKPSTGLATGGELHDKEDHLPKDDVEDQPQNLCSTVVERPSLELVVTEAPQPDEFDTWWQRYPRKVAKADARKAWEKMDRIEKGLASEVISDHARLWAAEGRGTSTIPYPATWLRRESWYDELAYTPPRQQAAARDNGVGAIMRRRQETTS